MKEFTNQFNSLHFNESSLYYFNFNDLSKKVVLSILPSYESFPDRILVHTFTFYDCSNYKLLSSSKKAKIREVFDPNQYIYDGVLPPVSLFKINHSMTANGHHFELLFHDSFGYRTFSCKRFEVSELTKKSL
jgi:hypothetical protein